jgi:hypothetical protein
MNAYPDRIPLYDPLDVALELCSHEPLSHATKDPYPRGLQGNSPLEAPPPQPPDKPWGHYPWFSRMNLTPNQTGCLVYASTSTQT